jgi:hypothetical protein
MTPELTLPRTLDKEDTSRHQKSRLETMTYTMNEGQLYRVWTVIRFLGEIRETKDRLAQCEILTDAQILLTAFVLDLQSLPGDQTNCRQLTIDPVPTVNFDA